MTYRAWRLAWFAAVAFVAMFGVGEFGRWLIAPQGGEAWWAIDFQLVLDAGARLASGDPLYADPKFLYPPLAAALATPLRDLDPVLLSLGYAAIKTLVVVATVLWLTRAWSAGNRLLAIVASITTLPFLHDLMLGNANALIVAAAAVAAFGPRRAIAGVPLGLVCAVFAKPFALPVLLWLLVWRRPVFAGSVGAGMLATGLGVVFAGLGAHLDWLQALRAGGQFASAFPGNHALTAVVPGLWLPVVVATALGLVFVLARRGPAVGLVWAGTAGILLAPYAGTYTAYAVALALPVLGPMAPGLTLAIVALSPIATGHALPLFAGAVLLVSLQLHEPRKLHGPVVRTPGIDAELSEALSSIRALPHAGQHAAGQPEPARGATRHRS